MDKSGMGKKTAAKQLGVQTAQWEKSSSLFRHVADAIRQEAFSKRAGELLGGEDELIERFGVSRPTFRQAAKLVEQEQLLRIKRGVSGGYFVDRPNSAAVTHMTAIYLRTHSASLVHIVAAVRPLFVSTARLAAQSMTDEVRARFQSVLEEENSTIDQPISIMEYVRRDKKFTVLFAETSGNPLIRLFIDIVIDLTSMVGESVWTGHPERMTEARVLRVRMMEAILAGDVEMAEIAAKRLTEKTSAWTLQSTDGASAVGMRASLRQAHGAAPTAGTPVLKRGARLGQKK